MTRSVKSLARRLVESDGEPFEGGDFPQLPEDLRKHVDLFYDHVAKDLPDIKSGRVLVDDPLVMVQLRWERHGGCRLYTLKLVMLSALAHMPGSIIADVMEGELAHQQAFVRSRFGLADATKMIGSSGQLEAAFAWAVPIQEVQE